MDLVIKGVVADSSVGKLWLVMSCRLPGESMMHPINIISIWIVISGMGTTGFLSGLSGIDRHFSLDQKVFKFKCLDEISVPYMSSITELKILIFL